MSRSVLVVVIVPLGIISEGLSIYNSYLQRGERGEPYEVKKLEAECSPYVRAQENETIPPIKLGVIQQIEHRTCDQNLWNSYSKEI
jgi:hypothetical protein